jgi:hypothetical protein
MKIGNVVSQSKIKILDDFNLVDSLDKTIQGMPTIIVGWKFVKQSFPNYNILDRKLSPNLFWTFEKTENHELFDEDFYKFYIYTYKSLTKELKYIFLDPFYMTKEQLNKFYINVIKKSVVLHFFDNKRSINMMYVYDNKIIYGLDLYLLKYCGYDINKITENIHKNANVFLESNDIFIEYKNGIEYLNNEVKFIPFLYAVKNG